MGLDDQPERLAGLKFTGSTASVGVAVKWDLRVLEQKISGKWKVERKTQVGGFRIKRLCFGRTDCPYGARQAMRL